MPKTNRIEKLTPEQEALLPIKRDHWLATGLSTEPANRAAAERGVRLAYEAANLPHPRFIIWAESPFAGAWAQALAPEIINHALNAFGQRDQVGDQVRDQVRAQVGDQVWAQVRAQVGDQVRDQVRAQVGAQVRDQVGDQVWAQVRDQVGDQVRAQVGDQVWAQVRDQVGDQVWAQVGDQVWAQVRDRLNNWTNGINDSYWGLTYSSWFDTMRAFGVEHLEPWEGQQAVAENAFWWWCFAGFAVVCERPTQFNRDEQRRLHSATGMAISWPDGWGFYSWHGTRVPAWVIENPTVEQAMQESNSEIRRAAFESIGWDKAIAAMNLTPIGTCADPGNFPHELTLYSLPKQIYDEPVNLLVMVNGSPDRSGELRTYAETVPANIRTPLEAAAWQYNVAPEMYAQITRRT